MREIKINEWPNPYCELVDRHENIIVIRQVDDARAIRDSLNKLLKCIPTRFGGEGDG